MLLAKSMMARSQRKVTWSRQTVPLGAAEIWLWIWR